MGSPDLTPYIDLSLGDQDPQDIYQVGEQNLQISIPDWIPRESNIEVLTMESVALQVAELIYALNRVPNNVTQALIALQGIQRDYGVQPTVDLQFTMSDADGYTVDAGTTASLELPGGLDPIVFTTDVDLTIPAGSTTGVVSATGDRYTADGNGTSAGTEVDVLDAIAYVDSIETNDAVVNGRDPEDDQTFFDRAIQRFQRLTQTLVLPEHFTAIALEQPFVYRAFTSDNLNPITGHQPGDDPGHVTVSIYGSDGPVADADKTTLLNLMVAESLPNLAVHVVDPTITTVNVTASVYAIKGSDPAVVQAAIVAAVQSYMSIANWDWSNVLRVNDLIRVIGNVDGVSYVQSITAPSADVTLTTIANLIVAGTVNVTVALS